jgi:hypothetical protein
MLSYIEDVNDNLNKENQKKSARNAVNIAFFDVSKMSKITQAIYLVFILIFFSIGIYYFYEKLVVKPELEAKKK